MVAKNQSMPLRVKLLFSMVGVVLVFLSFFVYFSVVQVKEVMSEQVTTYGISMSRTIGVFCIKDLLAANYSGLRRSADFIGRQDDQILKIEIYHHDDIVAEYIADNFKPEDNKNAKMFENPIFLASSQEQSGLGKVRIYLARDYYRNFLFKELRLLIFLSLILLAGDTIFSYLIVKILILNPLGRIREGAKIIGDGNFDHVISIKNKDEVGELAETVNSMTKNLKSSQHKIDKQTANLKKIQKALINILQDTEKAKDKIEEEQNKTFAIISNLVDPVIVVDNNLCIILINPAAKKVLGINDSDIGRRIVPSSKKKKQQSKLSLTDFHGVIQTPFESRILKINDQNYPVIEEMTIGGDLPAAEENIEAGNKVFKVFTSPVKDNRGVLFGHMKIFYDLTREKMIDRLKSEFISIAAHQLRTPSSGVKWSLSMILDGEMGKISEESKEFIKKAYQANERMVGLINDLLNVSRMEAGKFVYKLEKTDIAKMVSEIISESNITAQERGVIIKYIKPKYNLPQIKVDPEKIKLSIQNLVNNAIKYSPDKGEVEVAVSLVKENKDMFCISVRDHGIGVSKEDQKRLFSKFFRGDNAVRLRTEGSGLGLFIVKNVVEAHNGTVGFESELNKGSVFKMNLPIDLKDSESLPEREASDII